MNQLWEPLVPDGRVSRIGRNHPIGLPPTLTGIQPHPRMVRPCRSGKPPAPWGGSHAEEGSNFRPAVLETAALPTELSAYSWAGGIRTRVPGLNVRCSIPLSYSPAHIHRHDRRIVHHRHMVLPKLACLRPFQPVSGLRARSAPRPVQA